MSMEEFPVCESQPELLQLSELLQHILNNKEATFDFDQSSFYSWLGVIRRILKRHDESQLFKITMNDNKFTIIPIEFSEYCIVQNNLIVCRGDRSKVSQFINEHGCTILATVAGAAAGMAAASPIVGTLTHVITHSICTITVNHLT